MPVFTGRRLQIHSGATILAALVRSVIIMVRHTFPSFFKVLCLNSAGERDGGVTIGGLTCAPHHRYRSRVRGSCTCGVSDHHTVLRTSV